MHLNDFEFVLKMFEMINGYVGRSFNENRAQSILILTIFALQRSEIMGRRSEISEEVRWIVEKLEKKKTEISWLAGIQENTLYEICHCFDEKLSGEILAGCLIQVYLDACCEHAENKTNPFAESWLGLKIRTLLGKVNAPLLQHPALYALPGATLQAAEAIRRDLTGFSREHTLREKYDEFMQTQIEFSREINQLWVVTGASAQLK